MMFDLGTILIYGAAFILGALSLSRGSTTFRRGMRRAVEQSLVLLPRMVFALIAAGFIVKLIPTELIVRFLGAEAGFTAIIIGSLAGLLVPSGPVIVFAIAASFANEGASVPALVSFVSGWSIFAAHRIVIFEIPLLGIRFTRMRLIAAIPLPILAGALSLLVLQLSDAISVSQ